MQTPFRTTGKNTSFNAQESKALGESELLPNLDCLQSCAQNIE
jgi:hypothetical protein